MIKANELRIGNYLQYLSGNEFQVAAEDIVRISGWKASENLLPKPIPLSEDWLKRLGFVNEGSTWRLIVRYEKETQDYIIIRQMPDKGYGVQMGGGFHVVCEYVHRLQNLIHAAWFQELTLTNP